MTDLKTVEQFALIHYANLLSYLKTPRLRLGLLINFRVLLLKYGGIERVVH
jgi:GxxExxY protein